MNETSRLLIVDDEDEFTEMLASYVRSQGFEVDVATQGQRALEMLKSAQYDLLISDIIMPGMNGIELIQRVRAIYPEQPIIIITAHPSQRSWDEAQRLGILDYIFKPFDPERFMESVHKALARKDEECGLR